MAASAPLTAGGCDVPKSRPCVQCGGEVCIELAIVKSRFSFTGRGDFWGEAVYAPIIASPIPTDLVGETSLALRFKGEQAPGVYTFGEGANADIATCEQCPAILQDVHGENPTAVWFPVSGTLTLSVADAATGQYSGTLTDVVFREATRVSGLTYQGFVEGSPCVRLATATFDTRAVDGEPCESSSECPNNALQACDPRTLTCVAKQCDPKAPACAEPSDVCLLQDPAYEVGACYPTCVPFTLGECPEGQTCVTTSYAGDKGICKAPSADAPLTYGPCEVRDATTGCDSNVVCATPSPFSHFDNCYPQCDYFGPGTGCSKGRCFLTFHNAIEISTPSLCGVGDCHAGGMCLPTSNAPFTAETAKVGELCAAGHQDWICGPDAADERLGICAASSSSDGSEVRCRLPCRLGMSDCAGVEACEQYVIAKGKDGERAIEGIGICQ
jgi:hypothetical protein